MFERIDNLVGRNGFYFQAWEARYGNCVWAALGTSEGEVDTLRDLSSTGTLDFVFVMTYIDSAQWLPYAVGVTLHDAMVNLEATLAALPAEQIGRGSDWARMVFEAIDTLRRAASGDDAHGLNLARLSSLPATFERALAARRISG